MLEPFVYNFQTFLMILARILALFTVAPIFSSDSVNNPFRIFLAFLISLLIFPVTARYMIKVPPGMVEYGIIILSEVFIGVLIGFLLTIIFSAFHMAGEYFSVQIGFSYTETLDPVSQSSVPVISTMKNLMGIMLFLVVGAHRLVIESIVLSFQKVSLLEMTAEIQNGIFKAFEYAIGAMFIVAFKISLPVLGVLILVVIAEALMGKAAPQMNILQLSFPVKIIIGMVVLILIMPLIEKQMVSSFELSMDQIHRLIREWPKK